MRDALHRLVGERIVDAPPHDGFRVPAPTEAELRDLYRWNGELLTLALSRRAAARARGAPGRAGIAQYGRDRLTDEAGGGPEATGELFLLIARCSGSAEHVEAVDLLNDRLGPARVAEERLFGDVGAERDQLRRLFRESDIPGLRQRLAAYHKRRQRCVPDLLVVMRHPAPRR